MSWNKWMRQTHRWVSVAFLLAVVFNGVVVVLGKYSTRTGLMAVLPLALLLLTGVYLFVLPYAARRRNVRRIG